MKPRPSYQTMLTTKGQMTVPATLCRVLGISKGTKVDIYPRDRDSFVATPRRKSRILDYAGDLASLDAKLRKRQEDASQ